MARNISSALRFFTNQRWGFFALNILAQNSKEVTYHLYIFLIYICETPMVLKHDRLMSLRTEVRKKYQLKVKCINLEREIIGLYYFKAQHFPQSALDNASLIFLSFSLSLFLKKNPHYIVVGIRQLWNGSQLILWPF